MDTLLRWSRPGLVCLLCAGIPLATGQEPRLHIVVQNSPLAGFQYYDGKAIWDGMKVGDVLTLRREPANPHDDKAVRIEWQGHMLGYVPRRENADLARQMDHGAAAEARITELRRHAGRHRVSYEIFVTLKPAVATRIAPP